MPLPPMPTKWMRVDAAHALVRRGSCASPCTRRHSVGERAGRRADRGRRARSRHRASGARVRAQRATRASLSASEIAAVSVGDLQQRGAFARPRTARVARLVIVHGGGNGTSTAPTPAAASSEIVSAPARQIDEVGPGVGARPCRR
jgi:hypothetical protein